MLPVEGFLSVLRGHPGCGNVTRDCQEVTPGPQEAAALIPLHGKGDGAGTPAHFSRVPVPPLLSPPSSSLPIGD